MPHDMGQGVEPLNFVMEGAQNTTLIWGPSKARVTTT